VLTAVEAINAVGEGPIRTASCWPIDIRCRDAAGTVCVVRVKPINRQHLSGVAVSEAVSWSILSTCGLRVAEPFIVTMSAKFAADLTAQCRYDPPVKAGRHWGTRVLSAVPLDKDLDRETLDQVGRAEDIFRIFVIDELTGNRDRLTEGNLLLVTDPVLPARLVAIDQSDCFGGRACVCDRDCLATRSGERYAHHYQVMEQLLLDRPVEFVDQELALIEAQRGAILDAVNLPHAEWYDGARITPDCLSDYLTSRLQNLGQLIQRDLWRGVCEMGRQRAGGLI